MEVHNQMGNGFQEVIYQRALAIEFSLQNLAFQRELEMDLEYKGEHVGSRFLCRRISNGRNQGH